MACAHLGQHLSGAFPLKQFALAALAACLALAAAAPAAARPIPTGGVTVDEVAEAMRAKGWPVEIAVDKAGDPMIRSTMDGARWAVYFYKCKGAPKRCASFQLSAGIDLNDGLTYARINRWNAEHRFGQGFLDDEMDPFVQQDLDVERGATTEAIENALDVWAVVLPSFVAFTDD